MEPENTANEPQGAEILSLDQLDLSKRYSYADYYSWKFEERVELIKGIVHPMGPSPGTKHQLVSGSLLYLLYTFFKEKAFTFIKGPIDVCLPETEGQTDDSALFTVVQPDLCVICDPSKIDDRAVIGAPDLMIEILTEENAHNEMSIKYHLYEEYGVKEYWVVDPIARMVDVYFLQNGRYAGLRPFTEGDEVQSVLFPELKFNINELFKGLSLWSGNIVHEPAIPYGTEITSLEQLDFSKVYSYADYFRWKFEERVELIKGFIHKMSPAPTYTHQKTAKKLVSKLDRYFEPHKCEMLFAPLDVRLPDSKNKTDDSSILTVVQPDICIVCDPAKIDERGVIGAPDLAIEILSPGNSKKDTKIKFELYEKNGVKEYWIADPRRKIIVVYTLHDQKYTGPDTFTENDEIRSALFPELKFSLVEVFK